MKLSCKGIKPACNTKQFMEQAQFNNRDVNMQAFAEIITLKQKVKNLEEKLSLQEKGSITEISQKKEIPLNNCVKEEMILFQSKDQHRTNGE
jgi:hypothetical protein